MWLSGWRPAWGGEQPPAPLEPSPSPSSYRRPQGLGQNPPAKWPRDQARSEGQGSRSGPLPPPHPLCPNRAPSPCHTSPLPPGPWHCRQPQHRKARQTGPKEPSSPCPTAADTRETHPEQGMVEPPRRRASSGHSAGGAGSASPSPADTRGLGHPEGSGHRGPGPGPPTLALAQICPEVAGVGAPECCLGWSAGRGRSGTHQAASCSTARCPPCPCAARTPGRHGSPCGCSSSAGPAVRPAPGTSAAASGSRRSTALRAEGAGQRRGGGSPGPGRRRAGPRSGWRSRGHLGCFLLLPISKLPAVKTTTPPTPTAWNKPPNTAGHPWGARAGRALPTLTC